VSQPRTLSGSNYLSLRQRGVAASERTVNNSSAVSGLNLRLADSHYVNRFADCIEDFEAVAWFLTGASGMMIDDGYHVAATQSALRQVFSQSYSGVDNKLHCLSGNSVTNFVFRVASSFIQMDTTRRTRRFGPVNVPRIRYLGPYSVQSKNSASSGSSCVRMSCMRRSALSSV
jgi:hypothetical protein